MNALVDRLLNRLVGVEAGACVPNVGERCYCGVRDGSIYCYWSEVTCGGTCRPTGPRCGGGDLCV